MAVRPLSVDVALDVTVDGQQCAVWDEGDRIVVNAPTIGAARALVSGAETLPVPVDRLGDGLAQTDLTVELRVRHARVASIGPDVASSRLAERVAVDADVSVRGLAVAVWRGLL